MCAYVNAKIGHLFMFFMSLYNKNTLKMKQKYKLSRVTKDISSTTPAVFKKYTNNAICGRIHLL